MINLSKNNLAPGNPAPPNSQELLATKPVSIAAAVANPSLPPIEAPPGIQPEIPLLAAPIIEPHHTEVQAESPLFSNESLDHRPELPGFSLSMRGPAEFRMLPPHRTPDFFDSISLSSGSTVTKMPIPSLATIPYLSLVHSPFTRESLGDNPIVERMTDTQVSSAELVHPNNIQVVGPPAHFSTAPMPDYLSNNLAQPQQAQVYHQIARTLHDHIRHVSEQTPIRVRLQLEPPELGHVEIRLHLHGSDIEAHFQVEQPTTLALLDRQRPQLENSLAHLGITVKTIVISFRGDELPQHQHFEQWPPWPIKKLGRRSDTHAIAEPSTYSDRVDVIA